MRSFSYKVDHTEGSQPTRDSSKHAMSSPVQTRSYFLSSTILGALHNDVFPMAFKVTLDKSSYLSGPSSLPLPFPSPPFPFSPLPSALLFSPLSACPPLPSPQRLGFSDHRPFLTKSCQATRGAGGLMAVLPGLPGPGL